MSDLIKTESLADFGIRNISGYATEVNLDRAVPELYDGLKPVLRRSLWSAYHFRNSDAVKSAKVVGHCFVKGTMVNVTKTKTLPIEEVKVGMTVMTPQGKRLVTREFKNEKCKTVKVNCLRRYAKGLVTEPFSVVCTPDHVFYTRFGYGVPACELKQSDQLFTFDDCVVQVLSVEPNRVQDTYCIEVETEHMFFVERVLVHNCIGTLHPHGDCLDANTEFYCLDGITRTIKQLTEANKPTYVLSYDEKNDKLVPALAHSWRIGQITNKKYHINLSDGNTITCTSNHPFYIRGTGWVKAEDLEVDMPMLSGGIEFDKTYRAIRIGNKSTQRVYDITCDAELAYGEIRHHKNHNKHDDCPSNLVVIDRDSPAKLGFDLSIVSITVENCKPTPMYDFTVDKYHNALVTLPRTYKGVKTFVVAHNSSTYGAMQTLVHHNVPLLEGIGNWGGLLDPAAAYRYTNCKLSRLGQSVFDANYASVMDMVPNFDDTTKEPVTLPVRLPFLVLNGAEGIGVGITCSIPTFTLDSVLDVLTRLFSGEKLREKEFAKLLKPKQHWGGQLVNTKQNKEQWLQLMATGKAKIQFESALEVDEVKKEITISEWHLLNPEKFIQKVRLYPECQRAYNSKGSTTFKIECKKAYNSVQFEQFVSKIKKLATSSANYRFNCTHRVSETNDGITTYKTEFLSLSVVEFFYRWCKLRLALEKKSLEYQIAKQQEAIDYSELLIFASTKLDVIFKALRVENANAYLVKHLKITEGQANQILDLKVRALSKLDQTQLKTKLKEQQAYMAKLAKYYKAPKAKIKSEFEAIKQLVLLDAKARDKRNNQKLNVH